MFAALEEQGRRGDRGGRRGRDPDRLDDDAPGRRAPAADARGAGDQPGPLAIKMAELLVQLGLSHSKLAYMPPETLQDEKLHSLMQA